MSFLVVSVVALIASALTLFSGFGLGTLLLPAFALFFPIEVALAATGIVHLANNVFKAVLMAKHANMRVVLLFGVPAAVAAGLGALLLSQFTATTPLASYTLAGREFTITLVNLVIAGLMAAIALLELAPRFQRLEFNPRYVPIGGLVSGFFGGLSGHQGAFRAPFLVRLGLTRETFIGTSVLCAIVIDVSRLTVYGMTFLSEKWTKLGESETIVLVIVGMLAAFLGSIIGVRLVRKVTMHGIQILVAVMLLGISVLLGAGLIAK